ncbi:hypothetical protein BH23PSE1_BH23PSE1_12380 [soil metagenome]
MPDYSVDRDAFVARIWRRQLWTRRWVRARRAVGMPVASVQAAVYDATFHSDADAVAYHYALQNDHLPDLDNPVWLNEKIRWQFLNHPNPLMTLASDKIAVRDYLRLKGCAIEPPALLASGAGPEELAAVCLPARYVLKTAYGTGQIHVENGPKATPRRVLAKKVAAWAEFDVWRHTSELFYRDVPKRWLVEELLPAAREKLEYKIFCFMGEPAFIAVITARHGTSFKRASFDLDWNRVEFQTRGYPPDPRPVPRPADLDLMLAEARRLAEDFLHVRVDFLKFDGRLCFSELTFASMGARLPFEPREKNVAFGAMMYLGEAPRVLERGRRIAARLGYPAGAGAEGAQPAAVPGADPRQPLVLDGAAAAS